MEHTETGVDQDLIATLNDLLELDHDAVAGYTLAIESISNRGWKQDLERFREDHKRHIRDLNTVILAHGGKPLDHTHRPTGTFKAAVQAAGALGSDREVLLAFKANEGQVRNRYRRAADGDRDPDINGVLERNARDEVRHYEWVAARLEALGVGPDTAIGRTEAAFERAHGGTATMVEGAERAVRAGPWKAGLLLAAAVGVGVGVATRMLR